MELKILNCFGFTDYLFLHKQIVEYDGVYSNTESVSVGVPQGSILGPLLFLILFNGVHKSLMHSQILIYADDIVIFTSHSTGKRLSKLNLLILMLMVIISTLPTATST